MNNFINFNGKLLPSGTNIVDADNRGLRFGDGLFETIKFKKNQFQLLEEHFNRLWKGLELLQFEWPTLFTRQYLKDELVKLLHKNKHTHARVRLTIIRGNGGLYDASSHQPNFIIQSWQLDENFGALNSNGLQLCIYEDARKVCDAFSNCKHNNFLPYLQGAGFAKKQHCNDAVILNQYGRIADTTIANIFIIKDKKIYTPLLSEGCIAGTMRQFLVEKLPAIGFEITEKEITITELQEADEIFLTNAMTPMKWVAGMGNSSFENNLVISIHQKMRQTFPGIFC